MDFAVIRLFGKQHLVQEGDTVAVNANIDTKKLVIDEVLLLKTDDNLKIGTPLVDKAVVTTEVLSTGKGKKLHIIKFKAKSRYRRKMGFRPARTMLKILSINDQKVPVSAGKLSGTGKSGTGSSKSPRRGRPAKAN